MMPFGLRRSSRRATFLPRAADTVVPKAPTGAFFMPSERSQLYAGILAPDSIYQKITAAEASRHFDVTLATIRKWAQLGKISPVGIDNAGRKLYRLIDVAKCEKQTRLQGGREKRCQKLRLS